MPRVLLLSVLYLSCIAYNASAGDCPDDPAVEAVKFWKEYLPAHCQIDYDDLAPDLKNEIGQSFTLESEVGDDPDEESSGCRIQTGITDFGSLIYEAFPIGTDSSTAPDEGWSGNPETAVHQKQVDGQMAEVEACTFFDGLDLPKLVDLSWKVDDIMDEVKKVFTTECPEESISLITDVGKKPLMGKRGDTLDDGSTRVTTFLSMNTGSSNKATFKIALSEERLTEEQQIEQNLAHFEERKIGQHIDDDEPPDAASYIQRKIKVDSMVPTENRDAAKATDDDRAKVPGTNSVEDRGTNSVGDQLADAVGELKILEAEPRLCSLCGLCQGDEYAELLQDDDHDGKIKEQQRLYPEMQPNVLLQIKTPSAGSPDEQMPPRSPGEVKSRGSFRLSADKGYGDNFHTQVLAKRTPEDHQHVWAHSRALIETVKAEGIEVPETYHFFDHEHTAGCFQPAYNQGECGSCWAFASLGALEKQICLRAKSEMVPSLSREMLVRCSEQNNACDGGNADKAYEDLMEIGGVFSTDCLPYQGKGSKHCPVFAYSWFGQGSVGKTGKFARIDQELQKSCGDHTRYSNRPPIGQEWDMPFTVMYEKRFGSVPDLEGDPDLQKFRRNFAKVRSRDRVPSWWIYGEPAMKAAVVKYGSIYASFMVRSDFKPRGCVDGCWPPGTVYGEEPGFYPASCGCPKGHAVHIVGYGEDIQETGVKVPYWLIENSWGTETHGDIFGEDSLEKGVKGFGPDPFTEEHPLGIEDKCVLAGWLMSTIPRIGGCGGGDHVNIRDTNTAKPDGFHFSIMHNGSDIPIGEWDVPADSGKNISLVVPFTPGDQTFTLAIYSKNHPKQMDAFDIEKYSFKAMSLRCRGKGYRYSFSFNDTKASLSWGRKTRKELKAEADAMIPMSQDPNYLYGGCPENCRTGRYSWVKPCKGLLTDWGSCYTDSWANRSSWMQSRKRADCWICDQMIVKVTQKAYATKSLNATQFQKWFILVEQSWTAPDEPGWMRQNRGTCEVRTNGWVANAKLSATYTVSMPAQDFCDERHSAPYEKGKFVHAPGYMANGNKTVQRCPPPLLGTVMLECRNATLYAIENTCHQRPTAPHMGGLGGYYKHLRGSNYHGIESGAAFAIAEMHRFASNCPTLSWTKWSECTTSVPCQKGTQTRTREPIGLSKDDPKCVDMLFFEERPCVGPGFCSQVLTRFVASGSADIDGFMAAYKKGSTSLQEGRYATAGAHMMESATASCAEVQKWCRYTTGTSACAYYMEGHFQVKKDADYNLHYTTSSGAGVLAFNDMGEGHENKHQYLIQSGTTATMYEWQDLGFHHRRRRTDTKPWVEILSLPLRVGNYYARMTRTGWSSCPDFSLKLEQTSAIYATPILLGVNNMSFAAQEAGPTPLSGGNDGNARNLQACIGECDADSQCASGLKCFQRENGEAIPGCSGSGAGADWDYCYDPDYNPASTRQKTTTWRNDWGPLSSWYLRYRSSNRGGSYAKKEESGALNELVLRNEEGGQVIGKKTITKLNFTGDELYDMFNLNKFDLPSSIRSYRAFELVLRATVVLPAAGNYVFKYQTDTTYKQEYAWMENRRRRQIRFHMRAGGTSSGLASLNAHQGSATKTCGYKASSPGEVKFEVSQKLEYGAPSAKIALPHMILVEVKKADTLHGESLVLGSKTKYMSDLSPIRGDTQVRIDWPDRDDPLSSELKTQTFQELPPQSLLIGNTDLEGFVAHAEVKIDAGACVSLEAWAKPPLGTILGVGMNMCDVDGANQYLEMVTYKEATTNMSNFTMERIGWLHIGFTHPTHMKIMRDPADLRNFTFTYRPDNRLMYAQPFESFQSDITGKVDVGVSMNSAEAYRYAEFYNISIEDCPEDCNDASGSGVQNLCGEQVTACGKKLTCPSTCSHGATCSDGICMTCPPLNLTADQQTWECGEVSTICTNPKGQKVQVWRTVGFAAPSIHHHCISNVWKCEAKSKWAYLAEGKDCGTVQDENTCGAPVNLFDCLMEGDRCEDHKCNCYPKSFSQDFNCGSESDGCGREIVFGANNGSCSKTTDSCQDHVCCSPKTKEDFPDTYQCGTEPDGCGGGVHFAQAEPEYFITKEPQHSSKTNYPTGRAGFEMTTKKGFTITSLARGLYNGALRDTVTVSVWDVSDRKEMASVDIGPNAAVDKGYGWVSLPQPINLTQGKKYYILQKVRRGMRDYWTRNYYYGSTKSSRYDGEYASIGNMVYSRTTSGFPSRSYSYGSGVGIVNFEIDNNQGCGAGAWTCHANHSCTKPPEPPPTMFEVTSGPCRLLDSGTCVSSANYPSHYGNSERCSIKTPEKGKLKAVGFNTQGYWDKVTINGRRYSGRRRYWGTFRSLTLSKRVSMSWYSDNRRTSSGWKICLEVKSDDPRALVDNGGSGCTRWRRCTKCHGDCDSDADCASGLKCFQRSTSAQIVPGCIAGGSGDIGTHDYCYDPQACIDISGTYAHTAGSSLVTLTQDGCSGSSGSWSYTVSGSTATINNHGITGQISGSTGSYSISWSNGITYTQQAPQPCSRPTTWCTHSGSTYEHVDCDGDGVKDHYCHDTAGRVGTLNSGATCRDSWPRGTCNKSTSFLEEGALEDGNETESEEYDDLTEEDMADLAKGAPPLDDGEDLPEEVVDDASV